MEKKSLPPQNGVTPQMNSPLMLIESFLQALTNADKDGRIVITKKGTIEYLLFDLKTAQCRSKLNGSVLFFFFYWVDETIITAIPIFNELIKYVACSLQLCCLDPA